MQLMECTLDVMGLSWWTAVRADLSWSWGWPVDVEGYPYRIALLWCAAMGQVRHLEEPRLVEEAEEALAVARAEKRTVLRDLSRGTPAFDRLTLTRDLKDALARGEMFLQYQHKLH